MGDVGKHGGSGHARPHLQAQSLTACHGARWARETCVQAWCSMCGEGARAVHEDSACARWFAASSQG
eukprot:13010183-Alexandrium_andersonii.AAC.1